MKVRLLKPWNMTDAGTVLTLDAPVVALLIERGVAVEIPPTPITPQPWPKGPDTYGKPRVATGRKAGGR